MSTDLITPPTVETLPVEPILVDAVSAAKLLSISVRTLSQWTKDGIVPSRKIGGRLLFSVDRLREFAREK